MRLLDLTLPSPALNLALDEALLLAAEEGTGPEEVLRIWESPTMMIVMGRSGKLEREVHLDECLRRETPVYRRASGGGTVVLGPGCLAYAVVLPYSKYARLRMLDEAHENSPAIPSAAAASIFSITAQFSTTSICRSPPRFSSIRRASPITAPHDHTLISSPIFQ